jgi:hypothetical protein
MERFRTWLLIRPYMGPRWLRWVRVALVVVVVLVLLRVLVGVL